MFGMGGSVNVRVRVQGHLQAEAYLRRHAPKILESGQVSALNKCGSKVRTATTRVVARELKLPRGRVPMGILRRRLWNTRATKYRKNATVNFRTLGLYASVWALPGWPTWDRSWPGAKSGNREFPGTFAAAPTWGQNKGQVSVYRRIGKARLPIARERVLLAPYVGHLAAQGRIVVDRDLRRIFEHEVQFRLDRAAAAASAGGGA